MTALIISEVNSGDINLEDSAKISLMVHGTDTLSYGPMIVHDISTLPYVTAPLTPITAQHMKWMIITPHEQTYSDSATVTLPYK